MFKKKIALLAIAASAFSLSGCGSSTSSPDSSAPAEGEGASLSVAASFYPTVFLAERIGGEHVAVTSITPSDVEPHDYELSPAEVSTLSKQDLLFYASGFQASLDDAVGELGLGPKVAVDLSPEVNLVQWDTQGHVRAKAHAHSDEEGEGEGEHEGHAHGNYDPHFWLDPARMSAAAEAVATALATTDTEHAADYEANLGALKEELEALDAEFSAALLASESEGKEGGTPASACESTVIVTPHSAFGYLADSYGLHAHAIAMDAEAEPSPARIAELAKEIKAEGATSVFAESRASTASIQALAEEAGVDVGTLAPIEVAPAAGDYLSAMRANLESLKSGLRCG